MRKPDKPKTTLHAAVTCIKPRPTTHSIRRLNGVPFIILSRIGARMMLVGAGNSGVSPNGNPTMSDVNSINLFLDEPLVDELWTLAKRDGLLVEKVREASVKVAGKSKFGIGKLWQWMTADIEAELKAEGGGTFSQKLQYTSIFRSLLLPELINDVAKVGGQNSKSIAELGNGVFVELETNTLELIPLPTFAGYLRQMMIHGASESEEQVNQALDFDTTLSYAEKLTSEQRALTFFLRLESESKSSLLQRLFANESEEVFNALCMSNDDHVLGVSDLPTDTGTATVFAVLEERFLKRNLAVFAVGRPIRIFGRVAYLKKHNDVLGIQPVSIALG